MKTEQALSRTRNWGHAVAAAGVMAVLSTSPRAVAQSELPYNWAPLGSGGTSGGFGVHALAKFEEDGAAQLFVGGEFTHAGGVSASNIAGWNPASPGFWFPLGPGLLGGTNTVYVTEMIDLDEEDELGPDLYAGGTFLTIGAIMEPGSTAQSIARWNGLSWSPVGGLLPVRAITSFDFDGDEDDPPMLVAAGDGFVARWDGAAWETLGTIEFTSDVHALQGYDGELYAGGNSIFLPGGALPAANLVKWDEEAGEWIVPDGPGFDVVKAMTLYNGEAELVVGGANMLMRFDGSSWSELAGGISAGEVRALHVSEEDGDDILYVGGQFSHVGPFETSIQVNNIARFDGTDWNPLGSGIEGEVHAIETTGEGQCLIVYAGGTFGSAGGNTATGIAKFTPEPFISQSPQSQTVCAGMPAAFAGAALGGELAFQWLKDGNPMAGANQPVLAIAAVAAADAGLYTLRVTNPCGTAISAGATLTVIVPPAIAVQPVNEHVACVGDPVVMTVTATGSPLNFQWFHDFQPIPNAIGDNYMIPAVQQVDGGVYTVTVSNACGVVTSNTIGLNVRTIPAITMQPLSQVVEVGAPVTFTVAATGSSLSYQWTQNDVNIAGATGSSYTIPQAEAGPEGEGEYRVIVSNACATITSLPATLAVIEFVCELPIPPGAIEEFDPDCGLDGDPNGGCSSFDFASLACGQTIHGTVAADGGLQDEDWYQFVVTEWSPITWTVWTEAPIYTLLMEVSECPGWLLQESYADACSETTITGWLEPGIYAVGITPAADDGIACIEHADYVGALCPTQPESSVQIAFSNPPSGLLDPLQNASNDFAQLPQGIGAAGTPPAGPVQYSPIHVEFSGPISPAPTPSNVVVTCTNSFASPPDNDAPCPTVIFVTPTEGTGFGYDILLSSVIPTRECTTIEFAGTVAGERLQYRSLPGDVDLSGVSNTVDLLVLVQALNNGSAGANLARYDVNRSGVVNTVDLLRVVQLLNGTGTSEAFNGKTVAACPP